MEEKTAVNNRLHVVTIDPAKGALSLDGMELKGLLGYELKSNATSSRGTGHLVLRLMVSTISEALRDDLANDTRGNLGECLERE